MLIDARSLPNGHSLRGDVCIVGGGAAGLTLAHELARSHARVIVLESGGETLRQAPQRLHQGTVSGNPYYSLDSCRFRLLGGSTAYWGGWCRPLDRIDFEDLAWVPDSGWPFSRGDLEPFYSRAQEVLRARAADDAASNWRDVPVAPVLPLGNDAFEEVVFQIQPTRFGDVYGAEARRSRHVDVVLNATVVDLIMHPRLPDVAQLRAATLGRTVLTVRAGAVVLAAGGIENARILLVSKDAHGRSIGNEHDLVGRYFADHIHVPIGVVNAEGAVAEFDRAQRVDGVRVRRGIAYTETCRRRERALGFAVTLHNADDPHDVLSLAQRNQRYVSLQHIVHAFRRGRMPEHFTNHAGNVIRHLPEVTRLAYRRYAKKRTRRLLIGCRAEQGPNRDSRVVLDASRDALGLRKVRLEWRLSSSDLESLANAQARLAEALSRHGVDMFPPLSPDGRGWRESIAGGAHHMGTTRMHADPRAGVVDEHCRVHGTRNLFVAGSSVFPTSGWAPPTLTIIALALRLADHLKAGSMRGHG